MEKNTQNTPTQFSNFLEYLKSKIQIHLLHVPTHQQQKSTFYLYFYLPPLFVYIIYQLILVCLNYAINVLSEPSIFSQWLSQTTVAVHILKDIFKQKIQIQRMFGFVYDSIYVCKYFVCVLV